MLTEEQKIMRYAGNLACVYDYALCDTMERPVEQMSKESCLSAIRKLYALLDGDIGRYPKDMTVRAKWAKNIWDFKQQTTHYNNDSIIGAKDWDPIEVYKAYYKEKKVIQTSLVLNRLCGETDESIGQIAYKVGIKKWTLLHWVCFQEEISPKFQEAIIAMEDKGEPYTVYDLFDYVSAVYGTKNKIKPQEGEQS